MRRVLMLSFAVALTPFAVSAQKSQSVDLGALLERVGLAVERYYVRAQSLICDETVRIQSLGYDLVPDTSMGRQLTYELRVAWAEAEGGKPPEAVVQRELVKIGSRPPRPKDKPQCLDPTAVSPDTLSMLLPVNQSDYTFSPAGKTRFKGRDAVLIDYKPNEKEQPTIKIPEDREECFQIQNLDGYIKGRIWIDSETDAVVRLDQHLSGFVSVTVPADRKHSRDPLPVVVERVDSSIVYSPIKFAEPDEILTLPVSVDELTVIRNSGSPRVRQSRRFSNYRRFLTGGRIVDQQ